MGGGCGRGEGGGLSWKDAAFRSGRMKKLSRSLYDVLLVVNSTALYMSKSFKRTDVMLCVICHSDKKKKSRDG